MSTKVPTCERSDCAEANLRASSLAPNLYEQTYTTTLNDSSHFTLMGDHALLNSVRDVNVSCSLPMDEGVPAKEFKSIKNTSPA